MKIIHVITPGDHFSPLTGSAIPTVVHGISAAMSIRGVVSSVVVDKTTYKDRYDSCTIIDVQYDLQGLSVSQRISDVLCGFTFLKRPHIGQTYKVVRKALEAEINPVVVYYNAVYPAVQHKVENPGHTVVSWWQNDLTRTFSPRELNNILSKLDGVICCSDFIRSKLVSKISKRMNSKVFTILNGGPEPVASETPRKLGSRPRILFFGRLVPQKGVHVLLDAYLSDKYLRDSCELLVMGSRGFSSTEPMSKYQENLHCRVKTCDVGTINFLPFQNRHSINKFIDSADVVVVPSVFEEPFGLVVLEANARGVPVVHSRRGGLLEASGGNGLVFDSEDSIGLADNLRYLLSNGDYYAKMSNRSLDWARLSTWHVRADSVCHVIQSIRYNK